MESVVFEESPLSSYLEGEGEGLITGGVEGNSEVPHLAATGGDVQASFAPSGASNAYAVYRKRIPKALKLHARSTSRSLSRLQYACSGMVKGRLGPRENATFLERFRYTIIASDLLSELHHGHHGHSKSDSSVAQIHPTCEARKPVFSTLGAIGVAGVAFVLAGSIAWAKKLAQGSTFLQLIIVMAYVVIGATGSFSFARRKFLQHVRAQAVDDASALVANAYAFDAAMSTTVTIVQEVELVARGYRISTPLPPVSRLDDQGQQRRCARLRSAACRAVHEMLQPLASAAVSLERKSVQADLERYQDIYEITRSDMDEVERLAIPVEVEQEDGESLKALKVSMHQLFRARKLLLCSLLALDADGTRADFSKWSMVSQCLRTLSTKYLDAAVTLDALLSDGERFAPPATPKMPLTPSRQKARAQIRKLGGLSSGIRGLQAKMHMLREEADRSLDMSEDSGELSQSLLTQYETIGADLKSLLQEWEEGRAALTSSQNKRRSMSSTGLLSPRAETPTSLSGSTAVGGSPADAFRVLNGDVLSPGLDATSSDEEVFEAVAMPRQRSTLTREERITKLKEDRQQREKARESRQASTNMLRELETVLKHKPQTSKAARRVTVM